VSASCAPDRPNTLKLCAENTSATRYAAVESSIASAACR
jgi:hypothetical protein